MNKKDKKHFINEEIKGDVVKLTTGEILNLNDALEMAYSEEKDLVLMNKDIRPIICKIMDYSKFLYEQNKKEKQKPKPQELKEIKIGINTSENDLSYRIKHIKEFLEDNHRVKISLKLKGREMAFKDKAEATILKLVVDLEDYGIAETMPRLEGKIISVIIKPSKK